MGVIQIVNNRSRMEIINSDEIKWPELFLNNEFIVVNYQPSLDCPGCAEMNTLFEKLSLDQTYNRVKFLWVDSRNNPIAEQFIKKKQTPFIAVFKEGFLVECDNISEEKGLRDMLDRLFAFKFKL
jgi:thiol-disulfide isomerase/thioredoxin